LSKKELLINYKYYACLNSDPFLMKATADLSYGKSITDFIVKIDKFIKVLFTYREPVKVSVYIPESQSGEHS